MVVGYCFSGLVISKPILDLDKGVRPVFPVACPWEITGAPCGAQTDVEGWPTEGRPAAALAEKARIVGYGGVEPVGLIPPGLRLTTRFQLARWVLQPPRWQEPAEGFPGQKSLVKEDGKARMVLQFLPKSSGLKRTPL